MILIPPNSGELKLREYLKGKTNEKNNDKVLEWIWSFSELVYEKK